RPPRPRLVVSLRRVLHVVLDLRAERLRDELLWTFHVSFGKHRRERRDRIDESHQRPVCVDGDAVELGGVHATHCHNDHWTIAMPRKSALVAAMRVCSRGRPAVNAASARKNRKITSPKRGSESSGQWELG